MQLEEFRRKKAAEKAKKATSTTQLHVSDVINEKQPLGTEHVRLTDSNGVGTSDALAEGRLESSGGVPKIASKESDVSIKSDFGSSTDTNAKPSLSDRNNDINASVLENSYLNNEEYMDDTASVGLDGFKSAKDKFQSRKDDYGSSVQVASGVGNDYFFGHHISSIQENRASSHFNSYGLDKFPSNNIDRPEKDLSPGNSSTSAAFTADIMPKNSVSALLPDKLGNSGHEDNNLTPPPYQGKIMMFLPEHVFSSCLFSYPSRNF